MHLCSAVLGTFDVDFLRLKLRGSPLLNEVSKAVDEFHAVRGRAQEDAVERPYEEVRPPHDADDGNDIEAWRPQSAFETPGSEQDFEGETIVTSPALMAEEGELNQMSSGVGAPLSPAPSDATVENTEREDDYCVYVGCSDLKRQRDDDEDDEDGGMSRSKRPRRGDRPVPGDISQLPLVQSSALVL